MELTLKRQPSSFFSTPGDLLIGDVWQCYTLEDIVRAPGVKVYGETAIPAGRYRVVWSWSPTFKCNMPELLDVPGFKGVRIHWGNWAKDTLGCLLVGLKRLPDMVGASRPAYAALLKKLVPAFQRGEEVWINVVDA